MNRYSFSGPHPRPNHAALDVTRSTGGETAVARAPRPLSTSCAPVCRLYPFTSSVRATTDRALRDRPDLPGFWLTPEEPEDVYETEPEEDDRSHTAPLR